MSPSVSSSSIGGDDSPVMMSPRLLTRLDSLAKAAHATGDNRIFVEQVLAGSGFGAEMSDQLTQRLATAEDHYQKNLPPFTNESTIADTFNWLCQNRYKKSSCSLISASDVQAWRRVFSTFSPNLFQPDKKNCSPVESAVLLYLIIYNNGQMGVRDPAQSGLVGGPVRPKADVPTIFEAARLEVNRMSHGEVGIWVDSILRRLNI